MTAMIERLTTPVTETITIDGIQIPTAPPCPPWCTKRAFQHLAIGWDQIARSGKGFEVEKMCEQLFLDVKNGVRPRKPGGVRSRRFAGDQQRQGDRRAAALDDDHSGPRAGRRRRRGGGDPVTTTHPRDMSAVPPADMPFWDDVDGVYWVPVSRSTPGLAGQGDGGVDLFNYVEVDATSGGNIYVNDSCAGNKTVLTVAEPRMLVEALTAVIAKVGDV